MGELVGARVEFAICEPFVAAFEGDLRGMLVHLRLEELMQKGRPRHRHVERRAAPLFEN